MAPVDSRREFSLSFLQRDRVNASLHALSDFAVLTGDERPIPSRWWNALRAVQHQELPPRTSDETALIWYDGPGHPYERALSSLMGGVDASVHGRVIDPVARAAIEAGAVAAFRRFEFVFPQTFRCFHDFIAAVILARRDDYSGGTVSNRIGLIWLGPELHWTDLDWLENLVHEFVHNALFLEDLVHHVLIGGGDTLEQPEALTLSAIRQVKRGYDKAYHSAFVSFTVIEMYHAVGRSDLAEPYIAPLLLSCEELVNNRRFATQHGHLLLEELVAGALSLPRNVHNAEAA
ncbi:aKG-HExxH-type peptide beta-hydroxylase [Rhizorhabdus dicambivorans]|uniref:HEXXH motif domain-containing protein n=1 Tax=Rhizorhabdus dicambivorans TaxID=1850238 RepID=A0A2A4FQ16_9SPHN|nr:HEXXH motif-containing putative peptide modification protein [Rhizorhabdus dicambivorans]ATE64016.1 hypothetical protein CMV14_06100 [Rhizorhabdus dicambivorans]PCE40209.1 hypothetical protein COO09_21270 [Rhizorhabdus dicambivorans]